MFNFLSEKFSGVLGWLKNKGRLTEENIQEALDQVRNALLDADVPNDIIELIEVSCRIDILRHVGDERGDGLAVGILRDHRRPDVERCDVADRADADSEHADRVRSRRGIRMRVGGAAHVTITAMLGAEVTDSWLMFVATTFWFAAAAVIVALAVSAAPDDVVAPDVT